MEDVKKQAIETYNKIAKTYANYTSEKIFQYQLNKFISLLPKSPKVLDVGCAAGRDVAYLSEENVNVIGIDLSEGLLSEAKERVPKAEFIKMDFTKTSFNNEAFDGIWCMASLSDIPKVQTRATLKEFNRILIKGGVIYIAVKEGLGEKIIKKEKYENNPRFYSFFMLPELEEFLILENFQIVSSLISDDDGTKWVEIFARKI